MSENIYRPIQIDEEVDLTKSETDRATIDQRAGLQPPWYKIGMVWVVIALPLIVVVASMVTITIAHQNAPQVLSTGK